MKRPSDSSFARSRRVLIAPDKFKGTLPARAAAEAIARGWASSRPRDRLELLPMSDGGDGFGEVMSALLGAEPQTLMTTDAAHRPCNACWWWKARSRTAIIESANVVGLAMLPPRAFHPSELDTYGLGAVLLAAQARGARQLLIGIGGSATNDGGFGLAQSLGWRFLKQSGEPIIHWTELHLLARIQSSRLIPFHDVTVAVDVQNKLLGPRGATRIYGPQKGLRPEDFPRAEAAFRQLARVVRQKFGPDFAQVPGSGAAGGLGFGLLAFLGAKVEPGFELFARHAKLDQRLRSADLVITGEGAIDRSTLMGKGVGQIARRCAALGIPRIGLAGYVAPEVRRSRVFSRLAALTDLTDVARAKARPAFWLERLGGRVAKELPLD